MARIGGASITQLNSINTPGGDSLIDEANDALRVNIVTGTLDIESSPTFKDDPSDSGETPKYGKRNSSTLKPQVEATIDAALPAGANTIGTVNLGTLNGAATSAKQDTIIGHLDGVEGLLTTIDSDTSTLAGAVQGTEMQVDVLTMPTVTVQATNLDIRDLSAASDSVAIHGDVGIADQFDLTNSNPLAVAIVDSSGDQITSFGGTTQYTEDAAAAANPVGTALNLVRDDARSGSLTTADGDNVAARGTNAGEVYVKHVDTIAVTQSGTWDEVGINDSGNVITTDGSGSAGTPAGGVLTVQGAASMTPIQIGDNSSSITVDATDLDIRDLTSASDSVAAVQSGSWTVTANAGTNLNTSALALESGGNLAATATSLAIIDDWDESDRAKVNPIVGQAGVQGGSGSVSATTQRVVLATDVALPAGTNNIGDVDVLSVIPGTGATNLGKAEDGGHTSGDVGVFALGVRNDTPNATLGANADYTQFSTTHTGAMQIMRADEDFAVLGSTKVKKYYTNAGAVTDGIVWSPAAGTRWYVTDIFINVSAPSVVTLEDDNSGGDVVVWSADLAGNSGWSHSFNTPLFSGQDAADLIITSTAGTVRVMVAGYEI